MENLEILWELNTPFMFFFAKKIDYHRLIATSILLHCNEHETWSHELELNWRPL